jgi:hypothetical protein
MYTGKKLTGSVVYRWARQEEMFTVSNRKGKMYTGKQLILRDIYNGPDRRKFFTVSNSQRKCIQVIKISHK